MTDDERLRADGARIEGLLEELQSMTGPPAWQRVEELMHRLVGLYGVGLQRVLEHARAAGAAADALAQRLCGDELLSSLLLLHGLHPQPVEQRVAEAIEAAKPLWSRQGADVALVAVEGGVVRLRIDGGPSCPSARAKWVGPLEHAIQDAAPEVRVELDGSAAAGGCGSIPDFGRPREEAR